MSAAATTRQERRWVEAGYASMPSLYAVPPAPTFEIRRHWTLADLVHYIGTWSAVHRCREATGPDPTLELMERLRPHWGDPATRREIIWPLALRAGHKGGA